MRPVFHLSFPVADLDEAIEFYVGQLGAVLGRREANWADVALFDAQLTLHRAPAEVSAPMPRTRHFGATLAWAEWEEVTGRLTDFLEAPRISHRGSEREQAKALLSDPSGNLVELKAYRDPAAVLRSLVAEAQ